MISNKRKLIFNCLLTVIVIFLSLYISAIYTNHNIDHSTNYIFLCEIGSNNCVSSNSLEDKTFIEPIIYNGSDFDKDIKQIMSQNFISNLIYTDNNYYHFEVISPIMKYKDDLELKLRNNIIEIRSKSRVGTWDMGANRSRVEKIRGLIENI